MDFSKDQILFETEIYPVLPFTVQSLIKQVPKHFFPHIEEIRLRQAKPLMIAVGNQDLMFDSNEWTTGATNPYIVTKEDMSRTLQLISQGSIYAWEEELKNGYLTLPGGHRVGIVGKALLEQGKLKTLKNISGFNIRVARAIPGVADKILPHLIAKSGRIYSTLIISPPKAGKTTLLRDVVRQLSLGVPPLKGLNIGLVDERSEIACCYNGVPQMDVGIRTDVLDGCPKARGMIMLIRSMSPDLIATDEIGRPEDVVAIEEAINAGVTIVATVHGKDIDDIKKRPNMNRIIRHGFFNRYIILGFSRGVGSIEDIIDGASFKSVLSK